MCVPAMARASRARSSSSLSALGVRPTGRWLARPSRGRRPSQAVGAIMIANRERAHITQE